MVNHESDSVRVIRQAYFRANGLGIDGGYTARWARFRMGPITLPVPNTSARRRALPFHDLHHIATGYGTSWIGEGEIAAWELASGCGQYTAAWVLNFCAFFVGVLLAPKRTWCAFRRGRSCVSLYLLPWDDRWLDGQIGELRSRLRLETPGKPRVVGDALLFLACALPALGGLAFLIGILAVWLRAR